jgi:hypothetical protein
MVSGADVMLDIIADDGNECVLYMSDMFFEGAQMLKLMFERLPEQGGGGDYILHAYNCEIIDLNIWLCEVIRWLWGTLPDAIYFKVKSNV